VVGRIRLYRDAITALLEDNDPAARHYFGIGPEELSTLAETAPTVVLLDLSCHDSLQLLPMIVQHAPEARVVAFGLSESDDEIVACAQYGVGAYVFAEAPVADLVRTIDAIRAGPIALPPSVAAIVLRKLASGRSPTGLAVLTRRELELVRYLQMGLTNKEIAKRLGIQVATVKNHMHSILQKLHVHRRDEAASALGNVTSQSSTDPGIPRGPAAE
jgi:DNA-binding NarL/FixJ family response regulator